MGHLAYIAGGWVRDHFVGRLAADIDIATSASVPEVSVTPRAMGHEPAVSGA